MHFNPLFAVVFVIFTSLWTCSTFFAPPRLAPTNRAEATAAEGAVIISAEQAADGLDLQALPALLKQAKTAEELEKKLNTPPSPNNLDLDNDGTVDYLQVTEYQPGEGRHGLSLTVALPEGQVQEVATIEVEQVGDEAKVAVAGNAQLYGPGVGYSGFYSLSSVLLMSYFLSPHVLFASPFSYGAYPPYYNRAPVTSAANYRQTASRFKAQAPSRAESFSGVKSASPNAGKSANNIKKSLKNPTASQSSFQTRSRNKAVGSGGFGKRATAPEKKSGSRFGSRKRTFGTFRSSRRSFGGFRGRGFGGGFRFRR